MSLPDPRRTPVLCCTYKHALLHVHMPVYMFLCNLYAIASGVILTACTPACADACVHILYTIASSVILLHRRFVR